ncbi:MAG: HEPN domain-containing protein [Nitrospirae bacterium]|nr:HEPN domain-containing protein [Nitrospirota bacterium]
MLKFDIQKTVKYWLDGAKYDMGTATAMFKTKKYPYALFMGHLALEKLLKALVVRDTQKHAPYTHSLSLLGEKLDIEIPEKIMKRLVRFMEFHFEARYPEAQRKFYKKCTKKFTNKKMQEIKEVFIWLKERL